MILVFLLLTVVLTFCNFFVDRELALFVTRVLYGNPVWSTYTAVIPDLLFLLVCFTTISAIACYLYRAGKGIYDEGTKFFQLVAFAIPASYLIKSVLKFVFGRINTRIWLDHHDWYGFHFFQGGGDYGGFPSGHMAVFATLAAALRRRYPRFSSLYLFFLLLLAAALITTNYHFLSDVIAGAYLGVLVEAVSYNILNRRHSLNN
jgi:membrane-associated phospholipid phosphatase